MPKFTRAELVKLGFAAVIEFALLGAIQVVVPLLTTAGFVRDVVVGVLSLAVLVLGAVVLIRWIDVRALRSQSQTAPASVVTYNGQIISKSARGSTTPAPEDMPAEAAAILRRAHDAIDAENERWERDRKAKGRATVPMSGEIKNRVIEAASDEARWHRAVDTLVAWLYRRANWHDLSDEGRYSEPAPADWGRAKYTELGLDDLQYQPPRTIQPEKRQLSAWEMTPREAINAARERVRKGRREALADAVTVTETAIIEKRRPRPEFYVELGAEQQRQWGEHLCSVRGVLLAESEDLERQVLDRDVPVKTISPAYDEWQTRVKNYAIREWQLSADDFQKEVRATPVERSTLAPPRGGYRTAIRRLRAWLEANGDELCREWNENVQGRT